MGEVESKSSIKWREYLKGYEAGVSEERERCARIVEEMALAAARDRERHSGQVARNFWLQEICFRNAAQAIREGGGE